MKQRKRVVICWPDISGYMASCWKALVASKSVDLFVIAFKEGGRRSHTTFSEGLMQGIPCRLLDESERENYGLIRSIIIEQQPDVIILSGWSHPPYVQLAFERELAVKPFIMAMDTPWRGTWRQRLARLKIGRYLNRLNRVIVPGERAWQYARRLGFGEDRIRRGLYGVDVDSFGRAYEMRRNNSAGWPRRFLFTGRYVDVKAVDVLMEGYARYRQAVIDPWPLTCCGKGPLASLLDRDGITDRGFVQPTEQPALWAEHGVFVLPSRFDPWPLVLVEACAAGLPVICSEACGSSVELVRDYHNGRLVTTADPESLARSMRWMHDHYDDLAMMGQRGMALASAYSPERWAERWEGMIEEIAQ